MDFNAVCQRTGMGVETLVARQQGRVDVDHALRPLCDEPRGQHAHEARKADISQCGGFRECAAWSARTPRGRHRSCDQRKRWRRLAALAAARPPTSALLDKTKRNLRRIGRVARGVDQRAHIRAAARNEDGDAPCGSQRQMPTIGDAFALGPLDDRSQLRDGFAKTLQLGRDRRRARGLNHDDHADAAIEGA